MLCQRWYQSQSIFHMSFDSICNNDQSLHVCAFWYCHNDSDWFTCLKVLVRSPMWILERIYLKSSPPLIVRWETWREFAIKIKLFFFGLNVSYIINSHLMSVQWISHRMNVQWMSSDALVLVIEWVYSVKSSDECTVDYSSDECTVD